MPLGFHKKNLRSPGLFLATLREKLTAKEFLKSTIAVGQIDFGS